MTTYAECERLMFQVFDLKNQMPLVFVLRNQSRPPKWAAVVDQDEVRFVRMNGAAGYSEISWNLFERCDVSSLGNLSKLDSAAWDKATPEQRQKVLDRCPEEWFALPDLDHQGIYRD